MPDQPRKHGGARPGSGRKPTPVDEARLQSLRARGLSIDSTAARLGVTPWVVKRVLRGLRGRSE